MTLEVYDTRAEWLAARGIGASAAPIILGLTEWGSPYSLWAEMTGLAPREDQNGDKPWLEWGLRLEAPIAEAFAEKTRRWVELRPHFSLERHPEHLWLTASPDADQVVDVDEVAAFVEAGDLPALPLEPKTYQTPGLLQIKTSNAYKAKEWRAGLPLYYQVQVQHELFVTDREWATLCVLIGGNQFKVFPDVRRDDSFIRAMLPKLAAFQELVDTCTEPPIDDSEATERALQRVYHKRSKGTVDLPAESAQWDQRLCWVKDEIGRLETEKRGIKSNFKKAIGSNTYGLLPDGWRYSWKQQDKLLYHCEQCHFEKRSEPYGVLRKVR